MNGNLKRSGLLAAALLVCVGLTPAAQGASFDCGKAGTKVEHIICDSPYLSQLDDELHAAYQELIQDKTQADKNRLSQRQWMKERNACDDSSCVMKAYHLRQKEIAALLEAAPGYKRKPRFIVSQGKGYSVCENYARYLNSQPESTPLPLCHIPRAPEFPDLKEPDWEELDLPSNIELVYSIEKILSPSMHDRPVDVFDHWKTVFEQQVKAGVASPRLRRTHLRLLPNAPVETILAYEPDKDFCDRDMQRQGYAYRGVHIKLFFWNEQEQRIDNAKDYIRGSSYELLLYQGKPLLFFSYWGGGMYPRLTGGVDVLQVVSTGFANQYGRVPRCAISFELSSTFVERMSK